MYASSKQIVNDGTPETTYYVYDTSGQRVRKVTERQAGAGQNPTRIKERIYFGIFEIYREYDTTGITVTLKRETLHVINGKQRIALVKTRTVRDNVTPRRTQLKNGTTKRGCITTIRDTTPPSWVGGPPLIRSSARSKITDTNTIEERFASNVFWGGLKIIGGVVQIVAGGFGLVAPTRVTQIIGGVAVVHGFSDFEAGL
ncbi:hypothetical protein DL98DRAFT_542593 [Cadophora sp. DSE1049]|nr:hypothetical protein DL98DRAFT_542593 [Cadophora sp. DSE1049]